MYRLHSGILAYGGVAERDAQAFTSTATGNWNAVGTWTDGEDYPRLAGDTVTIASTHTVTIPSGVSISVGAITASAGANTLQINGSLTLNGNLVPGSSSNVNLGSGAVLDLNGYNVAPASACFYNFAGTSGSRCTVVGGGGAFVNGGFPIIPTIDYTDFSGLGDSTLGRTHTEATGFVHFEHCTVVDCARFSLEELGTGTNCGFSVRYNDFRTPSSANPVTAEDYQPYIYQSTSLGSQERACEYNTFDTDGAVSGTLWVRAAGSTFKGNVVNNWLMHYLSVVAGTYAISDNFFAGTKNPQDEFFKTGYVEPTQLLRNYFYYAAAGHPLGYLSAGSFDATYNVLESAGGVGANWFLWSTLSATVNIKNNIFLGTEAGIPLTFTESASPTLLDFSNNTVYVDNKNGSSNGLKFPLMLLTESTSTLTGTVNLYNNLLVDPDDATTMDVGADLLTNTSDQIDLLDYNGGWGYPGGAKAPPVSYTANVVVTAGIGANDVSADPDFVDKDRKISKWDASLGGAGTAANAIAEMLKRNGYGGPFDTDYTPAALVLYVQNGFVPQATDYNGVGLAGANIGFRMAA